MEKVLRIFKSQKGDTTFFIFVIVFVILTLSAIIIEYFRLETLYQKVEYELQRGVNTAVEYAILDEYRRDDVAKMDIAIAQQELYDYFSQDMKLDQELNEYSDSRFVYQLKIRAVSAAESPPRLTIEGWIRTRSIFNFLTGEIRLPYTISSSNSRID